MEQIVSGFSTCYQVRGLTFALFQMSSGGQEGSLFLMEILDSPVYNALEGIACSHRNHFQRRYSVRDVCRLPWDTCPFLLLGETRETTVSSMRGKNTRIHRHVIDRGGGPLMIWKSWHSGKEQGLEKDTLPLPCASQPECGRGSLDHGSKNESLLGLSSSPPSHSLSSPWWANLSEI